MTKMRWITLAVVVVAATSTLILLTTRQDSQVSHKEPLASDSPTLQQALVKPDPGSAHPLAGQTLDLRILGLSSWVPSELAGSMASGFAEHARKTHGYDVQVVFRGAPFEKLFDLASSFLSAGSAEYHLFISDSQWLGAFAEAGWIASVNQLISSYEQLDIEWWDPVVKDAYMEYPMGSGRYWGMPQEADVIGLYVRRDLFESEAERKAFKARYGRELPRTFEDFERLTMTEFEDIAAFFTRPEQNLYGTVMQYSEYYDFMSQFLFPFIWSLGGDIWDRETNRIYGVLNSSINATAMAKNRAMLRYQPPDAVHYGISENIDAFSSGKVATAFQWCAVGPSMGDPNNMLVMPPPLFERPDGTKSRIYPIGGQPWVINAHNDVAHMRMVVDFMTWWYSPETQRAFAKNGGNPATKAIVSEPGFEAIQPWFATLKFMLRRERGRDFWHHPSYAEMLKVQQKALVDYANGRTDDAMLVLEYIASQQQSMLHQHDPKNPAPPANIAEIQRRYKYALRR